MNINLGAIAKLLNKAETEVATLLKDGENSKENAVDLLISEFEKSLNEQLKTKTDDYNKSKISLEKKGFREGSEQVEEKFRNLFALTENLNGDALIEKLTSELETLRKGASSLTDDQVKASQTYINGLKDQQAKHAVELQKIKDEYAAKEKAWSQKEVMRIVEGKADEYFDTLNLIEGAKPETKQSWRNMMKLSLKVGANYKIDDSGNVILVDEKGEPLQSETGKLITLDEKIKASTSHVLVKESDQRSSGGAGGDGGNKGGGSKKASDYPKPKTKTEFVKISREMREAGVPSEERMEWQKSFDHSKLPE